MPGECLVTVTTISAIYGVVRFPLMIGVLAGAAGGKDKW